MTGDDVIREARAVAGSEQDAARNEHHFLAAAMGDPEAGSAWTDPDATAESDVSLPETPSVDGRVSLPTGAIPLGHLNALSIHERAARARERGEDWPTTDEARSRLFDVISAVMRHEDDRVVDAPTSLGKTYTIASTRWGARDDLTGGRPVVHLLETRDARDEAIGVARRHGGDFMVLRSRYEACPVAAGDHDEDVSIDGTPAGEWLETVCEGRGVPFSAAHRHLEAHHDGPLPCQADGPCAAIQQWTEYREGDHPLIIATHNFAYAPGLRMHNNVVIDEQPDYRQELSTDRIRKAVRAYLREIDAPVTTWASFIRLATYDPDSFDDVAEEVIQTRDRLKDALDRTPDREWYFEHSDAHTLAPGIAKAIIHSTPRANGRRAGQAYHKPPRLEAEVREEDVWNRERVTIVVDDDEDAEVHTIRAAPDFRACRSVVGLDAHPALPVWRANTVDHIDTPTDPVLDGEERALWRQYERGLRVVQVGDATRPLASGEYFDYSGTRAVVEQLASEYGRDFRTAITAKSVESDLQRIMAEFVRDPETMHFGEEKSRNDFAGEPVGFVNGCIDPGDDFVLDLLAELDLDAEPERSEDADCHHCDGDGCFECDGTGRRRAHGRGFTGDDAETAAAILASVRENHTAQAAGRYARSPDDPDSSATVFVRTDAMPPGFADVQVPGVAWTPTPAQEDVVELLRERTDPLTAREITDRVDMSKRSVLRFLGKLAKYGVVDAIEGAGANGATLYSGSGLPHAGVVDLGERDEIDPGRIATSPVWDSYTWSVAIRPPEHGDVDDDRPTPPAATVETGLGRWLEVPHGTG